MMVRTYVRKSTRATYGEDTIRAVMEKVACGTITKRQAFVQYGIPRSSLAKRMKQYDHTPSSLGRYKRVFTNEQEDEVCKHAIDMQRRFYGLSLLDLRSLAYQLAERNKIVHPFCKEKKLAGKDWALDYIKRRKELSLRSPEATSLARAVGFNRVQVGKFFNLLEQELRAKEFHAYQIFNADESGITTVQKPSKVIAQKGCKQVGKVVSAEKGTTTTIVCAMSASGTYVPPMIIFKRKNMNDRLMKGAPHGAIGVPTANGWMDASTFVKYIQHFIKHVKPSQSNPCMLILDGHGSHKSLEAVTLAKENSITLITIPPHTSHKMQPLDVSFYGPLKKRYNREVDKWITSNPGKRVTDYDVAELFAHAYDATACVDKAKNGFAHTGIFPYNPDVFSNEDFLSSSVTERGTIVEVTEDEGNSTEIEVTVNNTADGDHLPLTHGTVELMQPQPRADTGDVSANAGEVATAEHASDPVASGSKTKAGVMRTTKKSHKKRNKIHSNVRRPIAKEHVAPTRSLNGIRKNKSETSRPPTAGHLRPPLPRPPTWLNIGLQRQLLRDESPIVPTLMMDVTEDNQVEPTGTGKFISLLTNS